MSQVGQFDDATDDSVVPSTPKLSSTTEKPSSPQVPSFFGGAVQTGESSIGSTTTSSSTTPTFAGLYIFSVRPAIFVQSKSREIK